MTGYRYRAFVLWARRGVVIQGGRLMDHVGCPADADALLLEACELGWIQRRAYEPTEELRFFPTNGLPYRLRQGVDGEEHRVPCEYAWEVMLSAPIWTEEAERVLAERLTPEAAQQLRELELEWVERTKREREAAIVEVAYRVLDTARARITAGPRQDIERTKKRGQMALDLDARKEGR